MKAAAEAAPEAAATTLDDEPAGAADAILDLVAAPAPAQHRERALEGMRTARVASVSGRKARILLRGRPDPIDAVIAPEVDPEVIADALANGDAVLVELVPGEAPLVVAALHTRRPREIRLKAATIQIEGDEEVLLRAGRGALRIRADGDIELVGSRVSAASRGLFRIVGRMLRLN
jgi:hypothetical protein